jgi:hypothetical protein
MSKNIFKNVGCEISKPCELKNFNGILTCEESFKEA